jgi:MFS transporter, SP family, galactose:H+ symporter
VLHLAQRHGLVVGLTAASLGVVYGYDLSNIAGALGAGVLAAFVYRYAPETKGRQLEDIRHFWDNDGRWPDELPSTARDVPACR